MTTYIKWKKFFPFFVHISCAKFFFDANVSSWGVASLDKMLNPLSLFLRIIIYIFIFSVCPGTIVKFMENCFGDLDAKSLFWSSKLVLKAWKDTEDLEKIKNPNIIRQVT